MKKKREGVKSTLELGILLSVLVGNMAAPMKGDLLAYLKQTKHICDDVKGIIHYK